jgi:hypothetical protein
VTYCRPEAASSGGAGSETGGVGSAGLAGGAGEAVPDWVLASDLGIPDSQQAETHLTSLRKCTCQYPGCSGLLCRHQLALWNKLTTAGKSIDADIHSIAFNVKDLIAHVWLKDSDQVSPVSP